MKGSSGRSIAVRLRWVIVFIVFAIGTVGVTPVLADSSEAPPNSEPVPGAPIEIPTIAPGGLDSGGTHIPTESQMQATLAHIQLEEEEAHAERETPRAAAERHASKTAYEGDSTAQAEQLLRSQFGETLAGLNEDPARVLSDAKLGHLYGKYSAQVTTGGETTVMSGSMPIEAGEGAEKGKVDVSLEESPAGWETENALVPVTIGSTAEEGVEVGGHITLTQLGVEEVEGDEFGDKNVFFGEVAADTDQLVSPTAQGIELFDQLRSADSPRTLRFKVGMPADAKLEETEGGATIVAGGGGTIATIPAPSALDAQGATVPLSLTVEGDTIVVSLEPQGEVAYPVLVDPEIDENLQWAWYSGNTAVMGNWSWAQANSGGWLVPGYGDGSWPGVPGLFMWSNPGTLPGGSYGEWILPTQNTNVYMTSVTVSPLYRNNAGCSAPNPYPEPWDFEGLWDGSQWDPQQTNQANEHGWAEMGGMFNPGWGKELVIGMGTSAGGYIPCYRHIMIGGFEAWLGDWANPVIYSPSGMPTGWVNGTTGFVIQAPAYDEGLGVAVTYLSPEGSPPLPSRPGCTGGFRSPCPYSYTGSWALNGTAFDQGEHTAWVSAESPTLKGSGSYPFTTKVDRSPPEIALSNQLAEATDETLSFGQAEKPQAEGSDELSLPTYNLTVEARDGSLASPATKRSGVKEIEVELVGTTQKWKFTKASCPESSCSLSGTAQIKLTEGLSAGLHKVKIYATDFVNNKETREIEFEYLPATGIDGQGVLQRFPLTVAKEGEVSPELAVNVVNGNLVFHQRDVNVEGPEANLEIERFYNSQLPPELSTEWGHGWTLSQTPVLAPPSAGPGGVSKPHLMSYSAVNLGAMNMPEAGQSHYSAGLHAMVAANASGGYSLTDEGETTVLNAAGKTTEVETGPYSSVQYSYSGGKLAEVAVEDAASTTLPPSAYQPVATAPPAVAPSLLSAFGAAGSGTGQFSHPAGVALDSAGNVWVVDSGNNRVEEFSETGTFVKAIGTLGTGNGQFHTPKSIAFTSTGNFWVADAGNSRLEEFNAAGEFLKAVGSAGSGNGQFSGPEGIAIAPTGEIWVADTYNYRIEVLNAQGEFLRFVTPTALGHIEPTGVAFGPGGNAWVADWANNRVVEFNAVGEILRQFGTRGAGQGQFAQPDTLAVDGSGDVWVVDQNNGRVQEFNQGGEFLTQFGTPGSGAGQFGFAYPTGIAVDAKGDIWVSDSNNNRVQRWVTVEHGPLYQGSFGAAGAAGGQFSHPAGIARDIEGNLWVADYGNNRIEKFGPSGNFLAAYGSIGTAAGKFEGPKSIAFDNDGNYWVADSGNNRIEQFNAAGEFLKAVGTAGAGNGQFARPEALAIAPNGEIWVADTYNYRIEVLNEKGEFLRFVTPTAMGHIEPTGIAFGPDGKVWVADWADNRVIELTQSGELVRSFGTAGAGNGQFSHPDTVAVDRKGGVWVVDQSNGRVQEFNQSGGYVGQFGAQGTGTGQFSFGYPTGIVTDRQGDIWIADSNNNRVQHWSSADGVAEEAAEPIPAHDDPKLAVATTAGYVSGVSGAQSGNCSYVHEGELLTSVTCPSGTTTYVYDPSGRMTKVTLPNGTSGEMVYDTMNRVTKLTVKQPGESTGKSTYFSWANRTTVVEAPGQRATTYVIGNGGGVLRIYNSPKAPDFHDLAGTLVTFKETAKPIEAGDQNLVVEGHSVEGIASIKIIANGGELVDEKTCAQNYEVAGIECQIVPLEWPINTSELSPGIMSVEVQLTDTLGLTSTERFWDNIPVAPPLPEGVPTPPTFKSIQTFREEYDLDPDLNYATEELALHDRIYNLLGAWHNPQTPAGEVARASWERWGVPLRPLDVAELEYREWLYRTNSAKIEAWFEANQPANFAGDYLDNRAGGIMYVGFLGNQEEQLNQLKSSLSLVAPERVKVYPVAPTVSLISARVTAASVVTAIQTSSSLAAVVTSIRLEQSGTLVRVGATNVAEAESLLHSTVPGANVVVVLEAKHGQLLSGRYRTEGRMRAGDAIFAHTPIEGRGVKCTAGFGTKSKTGEKNGQPIWAVYTLTAGHCAFYGISDPFYRSTDTDQENSSHWTEIGQVEKDRYPTGEITMDAAAIQARTNKLVPQGQWGAGGTLVPTQPAAKVKEGETVCFSGITTPQLSCGPVTEITEYWAGTEKEQVARSGFWVKFSTPADHGDSGAAVWSVFGPSVGLIDGKGGSGEKHGENETFVEPLLTPPGFNRFVEPGLLEDPAFAPMSLKLASDEE